MATTTPTYGFVRLDLEEREGRVQFVLYDADGRALTRACPPQDRSTKQ